MQSFTNQLVRSPFCIELNKTKRNKNNRPIVFFAIKLHAFVHKIQWVEKNVENAVKI